MDRQLLARLGWPARLVRLIESGQLEDAAKRAQASYRELCDALDVWEAENSDLYDQMPWKEAREQWKAAGRPEPSWIDILGVIDPTKMPINTWVNGIGQRWQLPSYRRLQATNPKTVQYFRDWHRRKTAQRRAEREAAARD